MQMETKVKLPSPVQCASRNLSAPHPKMVNRKKWTRVQFRVLPICLPRLFSQGRHQQQAPVSLPRSSNLFNSRFCRYRSRISKLQGRKVAHPVLWCKSREQLRLELETPKAPRILLFIMEALLMAILQLFWERATTLRSSLCQVGLKRVKNNSNSRAEIYFPLGNLR